jgi:hypothetical protein
LLSVEIGVWCIEFSSMTQTRISTGLQRTIRRIVPELKTDLPNVWNRGGVKWRYETTPDTFVLVSEADDAELEAGLGSGQEFVKLAWCTVVFSE